MCSIPVRVIGRICPICHQTSAGVRGASAPGALEIKAAHLLSYWDSAIVAAARALGCRRLYSEDFSHGREIAGMQIVNPFR
jgi:predicted nucleic acid-binding protein